MKTINLFCLPFAGGNKYSYREYERRAPAFLKIIPLEYPGRGDRTNEPFMDDMDMITADLYRKTKVKFDENKYAIYGHSMGAIVAFLLTRQLIGNGHPPPVHLFVTGTTGPSALSRIGNRWHILPKADFINKIKELDGLPKEALENQEILDYFEPILRSDFRTNENYVYKEEKPLNLPLTVITGTEEDMKMEDIQLWQKETTMNVKFMQMHGKHFFISKWPDEIVKIISSELIEYV